MFSSRGQRGIDIKPSVGRGGYIRDVLFENVSGPNGVSFSMGTDGQPLVPGNDKVPLVSNLAFRNVQGAAGYPFAACSRANQSQCFNLTVDGRAAHWPAALPSQTFACKRHAATLFGPVTLPWPVCLPWDAPVNLWPHYHNYGAAEGNYSSLQECRSHCL